MSSPTFFLNEFSKILDRFEKCYATSLETSDLIHIWLNGPLTAMATGPSSVVICIGKSQGIKAWAGVGVVATRRLLSAAHPTLTALATEP